MAARLFRAREMWKFLRMQLFRLQEESNLIFPVNYQWIFKPDDYEINE
jgi:hypothetical protein